MLSLVHETPNRMRFFGPAIRTEEAASRFAHGVANLAGVTHVRANPLASSLVVHHQGDSDIRNAVLLHLGVRIEQPLRAGVSSGLEHLHDKVIQAVVDKLMRDLIDRLLGRTLGAVIAAVL